MGVEGSAGNEHQLQHDVMCSCTQIVFTFIQHCSSQARTVSKRTEVTALEMLSRYPLLRKGVLGTCFYLKKVDLSNMREKENMFPFLLHPQKKSVYPNSGFLIYPTLYFNAIP